MVKLCYTTSNSDGCFVIGPSLHTDRVCSWPSGREFVEVYVSSVANPYTFFVQILTSMSLRLDEVVKSMSQYYATERQVRIHITLLRQKLVSMLQGYAIERQMGILQYHATEIQVREHLKYYVTVLRQGKTGKTCNNTMLQYNRLANMKQYLYYATESSQSTMPWNCLQTMHVRDRLKNMEQGYATL